MSGISNQFTALIAQRPMFDWELPGPLAMVESRITGLNRIYRALGSHWRIRGERVPNEIGRRYHFVMEFQAEASNRGVTA